MPRRKARARRHVPHRSPSGGTLANARDLPDIREVLAGRVSVNPDVLFDLIHAVNPTGQGLSKTVHSRRYREKSELQSLLIRRFGDDYLDVARTGHDNVVSLQSLTGWRDACHAALSELDADARAWILRQLDLADSLPSPPGRGAGGARLRGEGDDEPWPENEADDDEAGNDGGEDAAALLKRGRQAMESYDYEAAERWLKLAFAQALGSPRDDGALVVATALALLELLVDRLGLNPQALELEPRLTARAGAHPAVRTLLALAAARLGETRRALELLKGVSPARRGMSEQRVADVYATLAAEALRQADLEAARRYLGLVTEYDATHPQIARLAEETETLLARHLASAEDELGRRYRSAGAGAVAEEARALADRGSRSELVRRILREASGQRREAEIAEHLASADQALADGHLAAAARHYQATADAGCERPDLGTLVRDLLQRDRRRRDDAQLDAALSRFTNNVDRDALAGYLALSQELRRRLRERLGDGSGKAEIDALEELGAPSSGAKAHAAVAAVLDLSRAKRKVERQAAADPLGAKVLAELAPHQALLEKLGEARELTAEVRSRLDALRLHHDEGALAQAEAAFQEGRISRVRKLMGELGRADLTAEHRTRFEELRARIRSVESVRRLEEEVERHLAAEDLLGAMRRVHRLAALTDGDAKRRWLDEADRLCQQVKTAWRVEVTDEPVPLGSHQGFVPNPFSDPPLVVVDDEGRRLVLVNAWEAWLFLRVVDVARNEVIRRISLRPPETFDTPVSACWNGDRVSVASPNGYYLEIRPEDGAILAWRSLCDLVPRGYEVSGMSALPSCRHVWISTRKGQLKKTQGRRKDRTGQMFTADLDVGLLGRKLPPGRSWAIPVLGAGDALTCPLGGIRGGRLCPPPREPRVILSGMEMPPRLYSARGVPEARQPILADPVLFAGASPDGQGLLLMASNTDPAVRHLVSGDEVDDIDDEFVPLVGVVLVRAETTPEGGFRLTSGLEFGKAIKSGANMVASSLAQGLGFALVRGNELNCDLVAFESVEGELSELYRVPVPNDSCLVCDRCSRHVVLLVSDASGLAVHRLEGRPPSVPLGDVAAPDDQRFPVLQGPFKCWDFPHDRIDDDLTLVNTLRKTGSLSKTKSLRLLRSFAADCENPYQLVFTCRFMRQDDFPESIREPFIRELVKRYPGETGFALLEAETEAEEGNWQRVLEILRPIELRERDVTDCLVSHYHHLLGLARLYTGERDEALAAFEEGLRHEKYGICRFEPLIRLTTPMSDAPEPSEWAPDQPLVRQLMGAVKTAERALEAGDAAAATFALERPVVWKEAEVQCAARLAEAWLATEAATPPQRFYKRLALAFFLDVHEAEGEFRQEILLPGLSWEPSRLEDLARRAREWLCG